MKNESSKQAQKQALRKTDVSGSLRMLKKQLREAVANYMYSEGCNCCRGNDHDAHAEALAKLLSVKKYSDGSGFDFYSYRTGADKQ
jgi:hypothetical protein